MSQPFVLGVACQPQSDNVPKGVVFSNASGNVCNPVASTVKQNSPLPTEKRVGQAPAQGHIVPGDERLTIDRGGDGGQQAKTEQQQAAEGASLTEQVDGRRPHWFYRFYFTADGALVLA